MHVNIQTAPYCEKCSEFEPDLIHNCLCDEKGLAIDRVLVLRCINKNRCSRIAGYIREELEKKAADAER